MIETPSMSLGIFTPAISKNVGAKSMFKTMSFILDKDKIINQVRLSFHEERLNRLEKEKMEIAKTYSIHLGEMIRTLCEIQKLSSYDGDNLSSVKSG